MRVLLFLMLACGAGFASPQSANSGLPGGPGSQAPASPQPANSRLAGGAAKAARTGAPARWPIASIAVDGNHFFTREQVLAVAGLRVGQVAGKSDFEAARDRLLASGAFETVGYKFVQAPDGKGYAATLELAEVVQIYPVDFQDLHVSSLDLDASLRTKDPLYSRERMPATQPVIGRYRQWIEQFLEAKGVPEKIAGSVQPALDGGYAIVFRPDRPLPAVAYVSFEGNQVVPQDQLRAAIVGAVGAPYTEDAFRQILSAAIKPVYEDKGYVRVAFPELRTKPAEDVKGVHVFVTVNEGVPYALGKVIVEGPSPLSSDRLLRAADIKGGDANVRGHVNEGVEKMRQALRHAGYLDAQVFSERRIDDVKKIVNIAVRVEAGEQYHMGRLTITGLDLTAEAEMKRIWGMPEGRPFNPDYPDNFLKGIREEGMFDNLGETKADVKLNQKEHTADVTLTFKGAPPKPNGPGRGRGGRGGWPGENFR
jgi:outer membrane protein insertion porin family